MAFVLPLSVYASQGYDIALIKKKCKDVEEHPVLGKTYKVDLKSVTTGDTRQKVWADLYELAGEQQSNARRKSKKPKKQCSSASSSYSSSSSTKK